MKKKLKKLLAVVLLAAMAITLFPVIGATTTTAYADEKPDNGLELTKTATLQDDGTYTIDLSAYVTGTVSTETKKIPADIILVLDASKSMDGSNMYYAVTPKNSDLKGSSSYYLLINNSYRKLTTSVSGNTYSYKASNSSITFQSTTGADTVPTITDGSGNTYTIYAYGTRMAAVAYYAKMFANTIVSDASSSGLNHRIAIVGFNSSATMYIGSSTSTTNYSGAFMSASTQSGDITNAINKWAASYSEGTRSDTGLDMARSIFAANPITGEDRSRVVIFMTDGVPTNTSSSYGTSFNPDVANDAEDYTNGTNTGNDNAGLTGLKNTYNAKVLSVLVTNSTTSTDMKTYMNLIDSRSTGYTDAKDAATLTDFFSEATSAIVTPSATLTKSAYVYDEWSSDFTVDPTSFTTANVTVKKVAYQAGATFDEENPTDVDGAKVELVTEGDNIIGVKVSGFDFSDSANACVTKTGSSDVTGYKLEITITGVLAKDSAATGSAVNTNSANSGVWDNGTEFEQFPMPTTKLDTKLFVFDYAKTAELTTLGTGLKYDSSADDIFSEITDDGDYTFANATKDTKYGTFTLTSDNKLSYTPTTTNWDGYDAFYTFKSDSTTASNRLWTKVAAIPANNVYYEDSFVMTSTDGTTATGTVGIKYSDNWSVEGTAENRTETVNEAEQGNISSLLNETTWTDGTAHVSSTKGSTATFTFTGTGVDIYTSTNAKSGIVTATLTGGDLEKTKALIVNNEYDSGTLYQIPTLSWQGLTNGTYTVTLYVMPDSNASDANCTYYLDGIRIYKPLATEDATVKEAYGSGETNVSFYEVRDTLIDSNSLGDETTAGSVFIDSRSGSGEQITSVGTYEDYGPKNEVYLAKGQAIVFTLKSGVSMVSVGLKSPDGLGTEATFTYGTNNTSSQAITSTADLYYQIVPDGSGRIMIKNNGDNLLAITKLKYKFSDGADHGSESPIEYTSGDDALTYAASFDALGTVDYYGVPEEEDYVYDLSVSDETEQPAAEETVVEEQPAVEVQIANAEQIATNDAALAFVRNLFAGIRNILGRR